LGVTENSSSQIRNSSNNNHTNNTNNNTIASYYSQTNNNKSNTILSDRSSINKHQTSSQQPFELTIRVDVILPHNQRTVVRVKPDISLEDLLSVITQERSLDKRQYELLLHENIENSNSEKRIIPIESMKDSLQKYRTKEVTLLPKGLNPSVDTAKILSKVLF
jgi:hypothetical protein